MNGKLRLKSSSILSLLGLFLCLGLATPVSAQENKNPSPFGYSLKRPKTGTSEPDKEKVNPNPAGDDLPAPDEIVRVDTSMVVLDVLVTDADGTRSISGLTKDDFIVSEDGEGQEVASFTLGDDAAHLPRSIVLVFDRSGSELPYIEASIKAAKRLVDQLTPYDEMAIVTDDVQLVMTFTKDKKKLKNTLDELKKWTVTGFHSRSMQFSALLATLRELIDVKQRRPIIIFQTDGDEVERLSRKSGQGSTFDYDLKSVFSEAERSRARIYSVIPNDRLVGIPEEEVAKRLDLIREKRLLAQAKYGDMWYGAKRILPEPDNRSTTFTLPPPKPKEFEEKILKMMRDNLVNGQTAVLQVAEMTGGWASFLERPDQADEIYGKILADINQRYVIGYYPKNKELDGKLRKVRVEVRGHHKYVIQARQSYYAVPR